MKRRTVISVYILVLFLLTSVFCSCNRTSNETQDQSATQTEKETTYKIFIVMDTIDTWSEPIRAGFQEKMDEVLADWNSAAQYSVFDTMLDPSKATEIKETIILEKPDLICVIAYPNGFADMLITAELPGDEYKFVSENCVPQEIGLIDSWEAPGGNVTGVGVFIQMNSLLRLTKQIMPDFKTLYSYSWDIMTHVNNWFRNELERACQEEGIELQEFKLVKSAEEELSFIESLNNEADTIAVLPAISAFVHADGSQADMKNLYRPFLQGKLHYPVLSYADDMMDIGTPIAVSVIWQDIGVQLAEKGIKILEGTNPGTIPWEYPRKHNILLNSKSLENLGLTIPENILKAAYRIYTNYEGDFIGKTQ